MKKSLLFATMAILCSAMLSAVGAANAADLTRSFVADNGKVFQIENALTVEQVAGGVAVRQQISGSTETFPDATGALWTKINTSLFFHSTYSRIIESGRARYLNSTMVASVVCQSTGTTIGWMNWGAENISDGCQTHALLRAASN